MHECINAFFGARQDGRPVHAISPEQEPITSLRKNLVLPVQDLLPVTIEDGLNFAPKALITVSHIQAPWL